MGSVTRNTIRASGRDTWRQRHAHDDDVFFVARMGLCQWDCCVLDCKCPQPDNHIFLQLSISTAPENVAQLRCVIDNYLTPNKDAWHQTPNIERQVADLTATTDLDTEDEVCDDCGYRIFRSLEELDATHRAVIATLYRQCMDPCVERNSGSRLSMATLQDCVNGLGTTPVKAYKQYEVSHMQQAIDAVKRGSNANKASKLFSVPRRTLTDQLRGLHPLTTGGQTVLMNDEESCLEKYIGKMAEWGHPISVPILKALAGEIHQRKCKTTGKNPRFRICEASGKLVAGRKWWRGFKKRHPQIAHRAQDSLSRERAKMSSQETVDDFFKLYTKIVAENRLQNKPNLIHNCDETGISMEVNRGRVLVPKGVKGVPCKSSGTKDRVTFHIAVTAEGKTLAPMLIYKKSFPSGAYTQSGPDNTLYAVSESGFMDKDLFEKWFCNHYVRTLPPDRPVLLLLDQCEAHLSPLDKTCFGSLKDTLGSIVQGLMFENPDFQLSKRNISKVVKAAYEKSFTMTTGPRMQDMRTTSHKRVGWQDGANRAVGPASSATGTREEDKGFQGHKNGACFHIGGSSTRAKRPPAQKKGAQKKGKKRKREEKENEELPAASRTMLSAHPEASSSRVRKPPVWLQNYVVASDDRAPARRVLVSGRPQQFRPMGMLLKRRTSRRAGEKGRGNPQRVLRPPFL
ncbi:hypothetical protein Bbelb_399280 [Branchiostoma belcheri]|nr:hypothetical protein Bbelb_399280 [Branchiostoma belcheri]